MGNMIFNQRVMDSDTDGDNKVDEEKIHIERRIFPQHRYGGPKGLGDPLYRGLSHMEEDPMIPQRMRDISRTQLCTKEYDDFCECSKDNGFKMVYYCRDLKNTMVECQQKWFESEEFMDQIKEEYLNERSHYRETGVKTQRYKRGAFVMRNVEADPVFDANGKYRPQKPTLWDESYPDGAPAWANYKYDSN